jgi:hypothetical protein
MQYPHHARPAAGTVRDAYISQAEQTVKLVLRLGFTIRCPSETTAAHPPVHPTVGAVGTPAVADPAAVAAPATHRGGPAATGGGGGGDDAVGDGACGGPATGSALQDHEGRIARVKATVHSAALFLAAELPPEAGLDVLARVRTLFCPFLHCACA